MEGISLSWILRIQELEIILRSKHEELQVQDDKLSKAEALLGQASDQQRSLQQQAHEVHLQKAQLQCAVFELETEVHQDGLSNNSEEAHHNICCQRRLDRILQQELRVAAKMKREQKEMQEFSVLMKSMLHDNTQHTSRLQDKTAQAKKQTEQMRCELALLQESISHVQQEQHNLQSHLAKQEQSLTQKQTEFSETETQLVQLRCDKQQDEQHAQEELNASKKLLTQLLVEQRDSELRLRQEQAVGKSVISKHRDLQSQMQKVKQAVLALSE